MKISASKDLDVHWCRPDDHGYRLLHTSVKIPKGTETDTRADLKAEHERLRALWVEHCPARISMDETWKAIGLDWGSIWLNGGVFFELDGAVYLHLGCQLSADGDQVHGAVEIMASEPEATRRAVVTQRKAA